MASGSRRSHTLGGLDFQALSTRRLLGSVGEVAAGGGCEPALWGRGYKLDASRALQGRKGRVDRRVFWTPLTPPDLARVGASRPCLTERWRLRAPGALDLLS